jgi:hypothetical protein
LAVPAASDVELGVGYGAGGTEFTGTVVIPAEADVKLGTDYGAGGTEFTGTYAPAGGGDWTDEEKAQIRYRLQIDGTQSAPVDTDMPAVNVAEWLGTTAPALLTAQDIRDAGKLAPTAGAPADGSIDDHLDELAAALAAATVSLTVVSAVDGDDINVYQAVSLSATITGVTIPAGWTKIYWTVKRSTGEADADAIIQMVETNPGVGTDGLLRLNGAAGTAANGSLTVDQSGGTVVIALDDGTTDDLALATGLVWSLKALYGPGSAQLLAIGTLNVLSQATMAVA